jgi:hypothetical protein
MRLAVRRKKLAATLRKGNPEVFPRDWKLELGMSAIESWHKHNETGFFAFAVANKNARMKMNDATFLDDDYTYSAKYTIQALKRQVLSQVREKFD